MRIATRVGMRPMLRPLLLVVISGCGVSTLEMNAGTQPESLSGTGVVRDAGTPPVVDAGAMGGGAGGGNAEPMGGGGGGEPAPVDAGMPGECEDGEVGACPTNCGSTGSRECVTGHWGVCRVPTEQCDNGSDDDCDGRVDHHDDECTPTVYTCESTEGGGCNGDLGYGDHCAAEDNTNNCSPARFNAWCNRRNPATPDIWINWIQDWVDSRCDGTLAETGTQYSTWFCRSSDNDEFRCTTPLVFSFDGAPVQFERANERRFAFTPGEAVRSDWPSASTPWLARDVNHNGRIDDGSELFGSNTRLGARVAKHGFEALRGLDENADGVIDTNDPSFGELLVWRDANGDRRSQAEELTSLRAEGVTVLSVRESVHEQCDARGNCERERSTFTHAGGTGALVDVYLRVEPELLVCR